ncbi:MAG: trigger factor [Oscillospiraceae bacterium]|nr:trigger factor [Oscillospiraceae bacterium]
MELIKNENIETNKNEIEVLVDAKTFDEAVNNVYRRNSKRLTVPGFRSGKAPRKIIEKRYGEDVFYNDAIELVYPKALDEAIKEAELDVVAIDSLKLIEVSAQKGLSFKAICILKPKVEIKEYKGIEVEKPIKMIDEKAVDNIMQNMRERAGRLIAVEDRAAQDGDTVVIDFEGSIDGIPFEGGKADKQTLKLGSKSFIPGFEDQIIGKNIGDEFDVDVTFPKDYHAKDLKGKQAIFKCKLHEIKMIELPEEDDEFAKDVSEFDTLKELKEDIKNKLEAESKNVADMAIDSELTNKLIENMKADIPEVMFENRVNDLIGEFEQQLSAQGLTLDMYFKYTGADEDGLRNQFKERAESQVKTRLALEEIVSSENIIVSDEELENEFKKLADQYKLELDKVKNMVSAESLKMDIAVEKAMKLVRDSAKITEKIVES